MIAPEFGKQHMAIMNQEVRKRNSEVHMNENDFERQVDDATWKPDIFHEIFAHRLRHHWKRKTSQGFWRHSSPWVYFFDKIAANVPTKKGQTCRVFSTKFVYHGFFSASRYPLVN